MNNLITAIRRLLIRFGKAIPFVLSFVVCISYIECFIAITTSNFVVYDNFAIPYTPISYKLASIFEYDWMTILATTILSYAVETCVWNKISIAYLAVQLAFKNYIVDFELEPTTIYIICFANIIVAGYLTFKGIKIISRKQ
jgi:hypothetical protein